MVVNCFLDERSDTTYVNEYVVEKWLEEQWSNVHDYVFEGGL